MENILENNRLIADFLGQKSDKYEFPQFGYMNTKGDFITEFNDSQLKFHKDWNWLIEAAEKIKKLGYFIEWHFLHEEAYIMTSHETRNIIAKVSSIPNKSASKPPTAENPAYVSEFNNPKEVLYNLVLRFIKYYNNQN
jgi:hypothetical protein